MLLHHRPALRAASGALIALILTALSLTGCLGLSVTVGPTPDPPPTLAAPAATPPASATLMPATAAPPAAETPTAAATPAPTAEVQPAFGPAWGDRAIYEAGLMASERAALAHFPGASEYRLDLRIADDLTHISGAQQVYYTNREDRPLTDIYVRMFPNALGGDMQASAVTVDGVAVTPEIQFERTALRIPLPRPLSPGQSVVLGLQYQIDVPTSLEKGYGLISYTDDILALDTPYLPIPVYNAEGWNVETPPENADTSFSDVSFYVARITAPAGLKLAVTGVEVTRQTEGGAQVATYAQGPARDFFLAASPDYVVTTTQVGETRVNAYALPGQEAAASIALQAAETGLPIYSQRFGAYPYTELDVAATPMLALGIEYPGAVGISASVYDPQYQAQNARAAITLESTVAHELAHQWFYNLVGNDQIDQPWLDEAMAQYATYLYYLDSAGPPAADAWRSNWDGRWDRTDRAEKPVGLPAAAYDQREYSSIVYGRGPLFVAQLAERMGQAKFDQFLKSYTARFRWGIATTDDFKTLASAACACDLSDLYQAWLDPQ